MREAGPSEIDTKFTNEFENSEQEQEQQQEKKKTISDYVLEAKTRVMHSLAGKTLPGGRRIPELDANGNLPTFEGRGLSYITYYGQGVDSISLVELLNSDAGKKAVEDYFEDEDITDPEMRKKIFEHLNRMN